MSPKNFSLIKTEIDKAQRILLHFHPSPDGDSVGSSLAMFHFLTSLGKKATVIKGDSPLPQYLSALPGFENVIDKNITEIDLGKFDLFISLDASSLSQVTKAENFTLPQSLRVLVIDHHTSNTHYGSVNYVDSTSPATCQIVAQLLEKYRHAFTYDEAVCLLIGLHTDTGGYKYPPTSAITFKIAAKLASVCPDYYRYIFEIENSDSPKRLTLVGYLLSHIENYFGGQVAISSISHQQLRKMDINPGEFGNVEVANQIKAIVGNEIGISMMETSPGQIKISFRKRQNNYDLSKIAVNTKYGGGHVAAAGATLPFSLPKAKKYLLKIIQETYPELGQP